jgi:hypothetical protein
VVPEGEALARKLGPACVFRRADVTIEDDMRGLIGEAVDRFGRIDCARRPATTIFAPSATKISAVRNPIPLVAPVITATLPSNRPMSRRPTIVMAMTTAATIQPRAIQTPPETSQSMFRSIETGCMAFFKKVDGASRLRGPMGAQFEFTLAAIAQNLRRLAKLLVRPPPAARECLCVAPT